MIVECVNEIMIVPHVYWCRAIEASFASVLLIAVRKKLRGFAFAFVIRHIHCDWGFVIQATVLISKTSRLLYSASFIPFISMIKSKILTFEASPFLTLERKLKSAVQDRVSLQ